MSKIKSSERSAVIQSLRNGVVPRIGLHHIQVGRIGELDQVNKDLASVAQGGATMRFVIGDFGAGKTFFLNLTKLAALQKGLVVMNADMTNDRRLQGAGGQAIALFHELTRNLSTRSKPDGGALKSIIERFIASAVEEADRTERPTRAVIRSRLDTLQNLVAGFDFADVLNAYYEGYEAQDEARQVAAIKWLRGEFTSKMEARKALGVRSIVDDDSVYDYLKLFAQFCTLAGYKGLLVQLDEMVSIYQISNSSTRVQNYEQLLRMLNDVNQGSAEYLGFMLGGTPEFLEDSRRGLYSHEPMRTRLAPNQFAKNGRVDHAHPVMQLPQLTEQDLRSLLEKVRFVFTEGDRATPLLDDTGLDAFIRSKFNKVGDTAFRTPRETVKEFVEMLAVLEQNPEATWRELLSGDVAAPVATASSCTRPTKEADLASIESFRL